LNKWFVAIAFSVFLVVSVGDQNAYAESFTVDFKDDGTFTTPSIVESGLTVTGSNILDILNLNGLGIVGGFLDSRIDADGNEFIIFQFDIPVSDITIRPGITGQTRPCGDSCGTIGHVDVSAWNGVSFLGEFTDLSFQSDISALYGDVLIDRFSLTPVDSDYFSIDTISWATDTDGDGFSSDQDCDDNDNTIFPGAPETPYDGVDSDCDGLDPDDVDVDGFPSTLVIGGTDCDDDNNTVFPGALEIPDDGIDQDCDGLFSVTAEFSCGPGTTPNVITSECDPDVTQAQHDQALAAVLDIEAQRDGILTTLFEFLRVFGVI